MDATGLLPLQSDATGVCCLEMLWDVERGPMWCAEGRRRGCVLGGVGRCLFGSVAENSVSFCEQLQGMLHLQAFDATGWNPSKTGVAGPYGFVVSVGGQHTHFTSRCLWRRKQITSYLQGSPCLVFALFLGFSAPPCFYAWNLKTANLVPFASGKSGSECWKKVKRRL